MKSNHPQPIVAQQVKRLVSRKGGESETSQDHPAAAVRRQQP
jgi:hypothetical protein